MSRSRRKTPIHGITTAKSEKEDKQIWHRVMRSREKQRLSQMSDPEGFMTTDHREVSNPWDMAKDGRRYWSPKSQLEVAKRMARHSLEHAAKAIDRALHKFNGK